MTLTNTTTIMNQIKQYIDYKEYGKPILLTEVVRDFIDVTGDYKKTRNTVSAYLNRLVRKDKLKKLDDGVFYKTKKNKFGEIPIDYVDLIKNIYFYDTENKERIGYRIGANVLANIGITNNLVNVIEIVTNNFHKRKVLDAINQNIHLKKPTLEVNNDNYIYLQLLDTIKEIDKFHLTNERVGEKLAEYMGKNGIEVNKLFKLAKEHYNKKTINHLIDLLGM
jgi:hypothetical protein